MIRLAVTMRGDIMADELRASGAVPAVLYGPKEPSLPVAVDARALAQAWAEAGRTAIVRIEGAGEEKDVLFRDVQFHPVTGVILHVDFYVPEKGKKIEVSVPIMFLGVAPAEKAGHVVVKALHEVTIEVAPAELPHELAVDVSKLENIGDRITAHEIALPRSATLATDPEEIVVSITGVEEEKAEEVPVAEAAPAVPPEAAAETAAKKE